MTTHTQHVAGTLCWLDLMTPRPEAVRPFYRALFGWTYEDSEPEFGGYQTAHLGGAAVGGLMPRSPGDASPPSWGVYFASDDAAGDAGRIRELGGRVEVDPMTVADHGRMTLGTDPTGAFFGLWQANRHVGLEVTGVPGAFAWAELHTRDAGRARDFYAALLGKTSRPLPGMDYHLLCHGGEECAGIMQMDGVPPAWMVYFAVENTQEALRQADAHGGQVLAPPHGSPYGCITVLRDPGGAVFSTVQSPGPSSK